MNTIVNLARETLNTPFLHQGRVLGVGMDCIGVAAHIAKSLGLDHTESQGYSPSPSNGLLESALGAQSCLFEARDMQVGDLLLMRFAEEPQHVAIFAGDTIIHSYQNVGKVVEHPFSDVWRARVVKIYRFKL